MVRFFVSPWDTMEAAHLLLVRLFCWLRSRQERCEKHTDGCCKGACGARLSCGMYRDVTLPKRLEMCSYKTGNLLRFVTTLQLFTAGIKLKHFLHLFLVI